MTGSLHQALQKAQEIELRVKGRRSGRQIPHPVWFVLDGPAMLLLPLNGPSTQWYRNILEEPRVRMGFGKSAFDTRLTPVTEEKRVRQVIRLFTAKYGSCRRQRTDLGKPGQFVRGPNQTCRCHLRPVARLRLPEY